MEKGIDGWIEREGGRKFIVERVGTVGEDIWGQEKPLIISLSTLPSSLQIVFAYSSLESTEIIKCILKIIAPMAILVRRVLCFPVVYQYGMAYNGN